MMTEENPVWLFHDLYFFAVEQFALSGYDDASSIGNTAHKLVAVIETLSELDLHVADSVIIVVEPNKTFAAAWLLDDGLVGYDDMLLGTEV